MAAAWRPGEQLLGERPTRSRRARPARATSGPTRSAPSTPTRPRPSPTHDGQRGSGAPATVSAAVTRSQSTDWKGAATAAPFCLYGVEFPCRMRRGSHGWLSGFAVLRPWQRRRASTWVHYRILNDPTYASFCDVNATVSCTEAYTSRFGAFGGVPVALFGCCFCAACSGSSRSARSHDDRGGELARLCVRAIDARPGCGALSRVRVVFRSSRRVPAMRSAPTSQ